MNFYTADDVLALARRHHNTKRTYLLINPLQAKHLPVSPSRALEMMTCLGHQIAEKYPRAKLVIGFAETATAIAAAVAGCLGGGCKFIHTTREPYENCSDWLSFREEHSHAVEQRLFCGDLAQWISDSPQIIFVDDEISTGKTLLNMIEQLQRAFPALNGKQLVAASILNRLSPSHEARFRSAGLESQFLVKLGDEDLTSAVASFPIVPPTSVDTEAGAGGEKLIHLREPLPDPRLGVGSSEYIGNCQALADELSKILSPAIPPSASILVLGTEECMYPSLLLGRTLEKASDAASVRCHATTRSPIGICSAPSYPIHSGYRLHSFYDQTRETYLYHLAPYDMAIVLTDTRADDSQARADLSKALRINGCRDIVFIEGGPHVQHL